MGNLVCNSCKTSNFLKRVIIFWPRIAKIPIFELLPPCFHHFQILTELEFIRVLNDFPDAFVRANPELTSKCMSKYKNWLAENPKIVQARNLLRYLEEGYKFTHKKQIANPLDDDFKDSEPQVRVQTTQKKCKATFLF